MKRFLLAAVAIVTVLVLMGAGTAEVSAPAVAQTSSTGGTLVATSEAAMQKWVRSVTVQVIVRLEKYIRPYEWYQEVGPDGKKSEWKYRLGKWSEKPEQITVAGSGVIIYSCDGGAFSGTYILTNAHVVEYLVNKAALGSPVKPLQMYDEADLIINTMPPSVTVKEGARPVADFYFTLPSSYAEIKYKEDQFFTVYAKPVDYDLALDVALLQVCKPDGSPAAVWGLPYVSFRETPPMVGEDVWVCGAPLALPFSIDRGRINQVDLDLGKSGGIVWNKQVKLDVAAAPGSSGSGIFDRNGYLIACLHGVLVYQGNYIRGGTLAIPGHLIAEWLKWRGWAFIVTAPPCQQAPYWKP